MKAIVLLLALVGYLPEFCSSTKSIHDWAHELGSKLGPGYSFREVERNGRACICSTTTQFSTEALSLSTSQTAAATTVTETASPTTRVTAAATTVTETASQSTSVTVPPTTQTETETAPSTTVTEGKTSTPVATTFTPSASQSTTATAKTSTEQTTTLTPTLAQTSTAAAADTTTNNAETTTFSTNFGQFNFNGFGARGFKCDDNVVPAINDRNAATKYSFSTPLYPEEYPAGICCTWRIVYPENWRRHSTSKIITYNYSPDSYLPEECDSEFVTVYDISQDNRLIEREQKCGHVGGQLGIIKHDGDERGVAFKVCDEKAQQTRETEAASKGKVAISFTVVAF